MKMQYCKSKFFIQVSVFSILVLNASISVFCMDEWKHAPNPRTPSPFCIDENPEIFTNIFDLSNPEGLWEFMLAEWQKGLSQGRVKYDPSVHPVITIPLAEDGCYFSLMFASNRVKRPIPPTKRLFEKIDRLRKKCLLDLSDQEQLLVDKVLIPRGYVLLVDTQYRWMLGVLPSDQEFLDLGMSSNEIDLTKKLWQRTLPDVNPLQTYFAYAKEIFGYLKSNFSKRMYCLLLNAFPIFSPHFLITSTIPDKPQCIADAHELYDLLDFQRYLSQVNENMQINFNSNNAGDTLGGASISVWHCQIADLGVRASSNFSVHIFSRQGDVCIGNYQHLKTTHRVFISKNQTNLCRIVFAYISVLHRANNAYNLSLCMDKNLNFRILLTIRGNWFDKNSILDVKHSDTPAFAEVAGSFIFTNPEEFALMQCIFAKQGADKVREIIDAWHRAASQDVELVMQFERQFEACLN